MGRCEIFFGTYMKTGIRENLAGLPVPQPGSNRGYAATDLIEGFMCSVLLGSKRLAHTGYLRNDEVIKEIFGWKKGMADQSTFSRFFKKHSIDKMTIDIDSTVVTRYGNQENAKVGYYPQKMGRKSHHPILAFCDELAMVVNGWMRTGDSVSVTDADRFIKEVFSIINPKRIGLMRFDAGFYSQEIMQLLERHEDEVKYIIRAKLTSGIKNVILSLATKDWYPSDEEETDECEYATVNYKGSKWDKERKMVIVRTKKKDLIEENYLFKEIGIYERYEYKVFVTNVEFSASLIHRIYHGRANAENRIKDLKYDFGLNGFSLKKFGAMEAAFRYVLLTYNIMALFKQWVMKVKKGTTLSTIKFQCIALGS